MSLTLRILAVWVVLGSQAGAQEGLDLREFGNDFSGADLRGADFGSKRRRGEHAVMSGANFTGADLRDAKFGATQLDGAVFRDARLDGACFVTADLSRADFTGATFDGARFQECSFERALLPDADLSGAIVNGCRFAGADLSGATLRGATNTQLWPDFTDADLRGADLAELQLDWSRLAGANLTGAILSGATLREADLTGADLTDAAIDGIDVTHAILDELRGIDDETLRTLRREAGRSGFERRQRIGSAIRGLERPAYGATIILGIGTLIIAGARSKRWLTPAALVCIHLISLMPAAYLMMMRAQGASPVAQLNAWDGRDLWGAWFQLWSFAMLWCLIGLTVAIGLLIGQIVEGVRRVRGAGWGLLSAVLAIGHVLLLVRLLIGAVPTA